MGAFINLDYSYQPDLITYNQKIEYVDGLGYRNVRTPEIQVEGGAKYGTKEVGAWIADYISRA